MPAAVGALVDLVLRDLGADAVRIHASADNVASIRLAEKLGFRFVRRFEHRDGDEVWSVVRYERGREA